MAEQGKVSLFEAVGGMPTLQRVHKIFYDKLYAHPWLKHFFAGFNQQIIEDKQTGFMAWKMGGPNDYRGRELKTAHRQFYIPDELFELRHEILRESILEGGVPEDLAQRWLRIDRAFKKQIVKDSIESFYAHHFLYEKRVIVPKPGE